MSCESSCVTLVRPGAAGPVSSPDEKIGLKTKQRIGGSLKFMSRPPQGNSVARGCARICVKLVEPPPQSNVSAHRERNVTLLLKVLRSRNRFRKDCAIVLANGPLCGFGLRLYFALQRVCRVLCIRWTRVHIYRDVC